MNWKYSLEKFHDTNRYFIPLSFVAVILMITGIFFQGPMKLMYDVEVTKPLYFNDDVMIQSVTLRPGWTFNIEVNTSKPVILSMQNIEGETLIESSNGTLTYKPSFFNLYFVKVKARNFLLNDFNYSKTGLSPYPDSYLFFSAGLILQLSVIIYFLLEPWSIKLKRKLTVINALFYPLMFLIASIVFWVFRDSLIWFAPKNIQTQNMLLINSITLMILGLYTIHLKHIPLIKSKKYDDFFKMFIGYFTTYAAITLTILLTLMLGNEYLTIIIKTSITSILLYFFIKYNLKIPVLIYIMEWVVSLIIKLMAFSIRIPVFFDTLLSIPSINGTIPLLLVINLFGVIGVYFLIRAYYSKNITLASAYGLYAGVFFQGIMQILFSNIYLA